MAASTEKSKANAGLRNNSLFVKVKSGGVSLDTDVQLSNGMSLGGVKTIKWKCGAGEVATCEIETVLTKAELAALMEDTTIRYRLIDADEISTNPTSKS